VSSKRYKAIWNQELKNNPHLFKTIILTRHVLKKEAQLREKSFQKSLNVIKNPLYINMAIGLYGDNTGNKHTEEWKAKKSEWGKGRKQSPETIAKRVSKNTGKRRSEAFRKHISKCLAGKPKSIEHRSKLSRINSGKMWWNNGTTEMQAHSQPDDTYIRGRIYRPRKKV
jgi:tRNA-dihydrouridine synthase